MLNIELRNPEDVMKLSRLGSFHQSKLSFLRSFIREFKNWEFNRDIFDLDKSRAKEAADKWKISNVASEPNEIINDKEIDAIIIATPNNLHHELTIKSANKKKHIFCEKPISINLQEANEMIKACKKNNVQFQIGFNQRFWSQVEIVKKLLEVNFIGNGLINFYHVLFLSKSICQI